MRGTSRGPVLKLQHLTIRKRLSRPLRFVRLRKVLPIGSDRYTTIFVSRYRLKVITLTPSTRI